MAMYLNLETIYTHHVETEAQQEANVACNAIFSDSPWEVEQSANISIPGEAMPTTEDKEASRSHKFQRPLHSPMSSGKMRW